MFKKNNYVYDKIKNGIWLKTPGNTSNISISTYYYSATVSFNSANRTSLGTRPVIDVKKTDLEK